MRNVRGFHDRRVGHTDVAGAFVDAHGAGRVDVADLGAGQTVAVSPLSDAQDVDGAFAAARTAFRTWRRTTAGERQLVLLRLTEALGEHSDELVEAQDRNTGRPRRVISVEEVAAGADNLRFFAGAARTLGGRAAAEYLEGCTRTTPWSRRRPLRPSAPSSPPPRRARRSSRPTTSSTRWSPACGPPTTARPCGSPGNPSSAAGG